MPVRDLLQMPQWKEWEKDPATLAHKRDGLFEARLRSDPRRAEQFASMPEERQSALRAKFFDKLQEDFPERFSVELEPAQTRSRRRVGTQFDAGASADPEVTTPARRRPLLDPESEREIAAIRQGKRDPWRGADDAETLMSRAAYMAAVLPPKELEQTLAPARERARKILKERGLDYEVTMDRSALENFASDASRRLARFTGTTGGGTVANLFQRAFQGTMSDLREANPDRFDREIGLDPDKIGEGNPFEKENWALMGFAYGDDATALETAGNVLAWAGGANAVLRRRIGARMAQKLDDAGRVITDRAGRQVTQQAPRQFQVDPLSGRGIAESAGFSAVFGGGQDPHLSLGVLSEALGVEPNRLLTAAEYAGADAAAGGLLRHVMRGIGRATTKGRADKHPLFSDLADLAGREWDNAAQGRSLDYMRWVRQGMPGVNPEEAPAQAYRRVIVRGEGGPPPQPAGTQTGQNVQPQPQQTQPPARQPAASVDDTLSGLRTAEIPDPAFDPFAAARRAAPPSTAPAGDAPGAGTAGGTQATSASPDGAASPIGSAGSVIAADTAPPVKRGRGGFSIGPNAMGDYDLLSDIAAITGGIRPPKAGQKGGEYDGYREALGYGIARLLRRKSGLKVDEAYEHMRANGYPFESIDEMYEAIKEAVRSRDEVARYIKKEMYEHGVDSALTENLGRSGPQKTDRPVPAGELSTGDKFKIRNEKFEVKDVDPDTLARTVEDGVRRELDPEQVVYVDRGIVDAAPYKAAEDDPFAPGPDAYVAAAVAARKAFDAAALDAANLPTPPGYQRRKTRVIPTKALLEATEQSTLAQQAEAPAPVASPLAEPPPPQARPTEDLALEGGTKADMEADAEKLAQQAARREQQEEIARRQQAPLQGDSSEVGQGKLFQEDVDLFSGPAAQDTIHRGGNAPEGSAQAAESAYSGRVPDWVRSGPETHKGNKLAKRILADRKGEKAGVRSIVDYVNEIVGVEMRRSKSQTSRKHPAHYRPMGHVTMTSSGPNQINFHEAGHGLKELVEARKPGFFDPFQQELMALNKAPGSMASADNLHEAVAEWTRRLITDPDSIGGLPVSRALQDALDAEFPKILPALRDAARAYDAHRGRSALAQFKSFSKDQTHRSGAMRDIIRRFTASGDFHMLASRAPIENLDKQVFQAVKRGAAEIDKEYGTALDLARSLRREYTAPLIHRHNAILEINSDVQNAMIGTGPQRGIRDFDANLDYFKFYDKTVRELTRMVPAERWQDFQAAAWAASSLERWSKKGLRYTGMNDGITPRMLQDIVKDAEATIPNFREAFDEWGRFFRAVLELKYHNGLKSRAEVSKMAEAWENYWPLPRQLWGGGGQRPPGRAPGGDVQAGDFRARGSTEGIKDVVEVAYQRLSQAYTASRWNAMGIAMADSTRAMAKDERLPFAARAIVGRNMQPLRLQRKVAATASPQELRQIVYDHLLQERAQAMGMDPADVAITFQPDDISLLYNFKDLWRAQRPSDYNVVSFLKDGDRVFYQVQDPIMFQYFAGNKNPGALVKGIEWMLAPEMQAWKRNITQSLPFAVANLAGDTYNQTIHGTGAISWVPGGATMLGIWHKMSRKYPQIFDEGLLLSRDEPTGSELVNHIRHSAPWLFMAEGLKLSKNPDRKARYVENLMQPANLLYPMHKLVDMINLVTGGRHLARFFETATREGSAVYAKMTGQSDAAAKWAYWNVTGPFNDHPGLGDARVMARMPGFFNPMMQANRNYWRKAFDPDPAVSAQFWFKTFAMIPAIFGASAIVRYLMMDETERERERDRPIEDRMAYYDLNGLRVRFPYGPEGSVGSYTYNAVMDHLLDRQPGEEDNKRARLLLNRIFSWEGADNFFGPQVKTVAEASRNWSSFRQRHIVAPWMASLPPSEQHYTHTPEFYKRLGRFLDYPPAKIEYMVSQGLSRQLDETIKLIERIDQGRPIEAASDIPYVGRMFIRDPLGFATASAREVGHIEERLTLLNRRLAAKGYASIDDERMHNPAALPPDLRALQVQVQQARLLRSSIGQMQRMSQLAGAARAAGDTTLEHNLQRSITLYAQAILTNNPDAAAHIEHTLQLLEAAADPGVEARVMDRLR